jgi:hypothetical protein
MFKPLERVADLPPEGPLSADAREKQDLDFKSYADPAKTREHAKDIAAFANALGGTLLIGAKDKANLVHHGLKDQTVAEVRDVYERAAMMCSPTVPIDVVPINVGDRVVVAVNVPPFPDAIVGAPASEVDGSGKTVKIEHGWCFPIRRASQTHFLKPEELPLYMNPNVRRAYVRLEQIPEDSRARVLLFFGKQLDHSSFTVHLVDRTEVSFEGASLEQNRAQFREGSFGFRVPLMDVVDVWEHAPDRWAVRIAGTIENSSEWGREYRPLP